LRNPRHHGVPPHGWAPEPRRRPTAATGDGRGPAPCCRVAAPTLRGPRTRVCDAARSVGTRKVGYARSRGHKASLLRQPPTAAPRSAACLRSSRPSTLHRPPRRAETLILSHPLPGNVLNGDAAPWDGGGVGERNLRVPPRRHVPGNFTPTVRRRVAHDQAHAGRCGARDAGEAWRRCRSELGRPLTPVNARSASGALRNPHLHGVPPHGWAPEPRRRPTAATGDGRGPAPCCRVAAPTLRGPRTRVCDAARSVGTS